MKKTKVIAVIFIFLLGLAFPAAVSDIGTKPPQKTAEPLKSSVPGEIAIITGALKQDAESFSSAEEAVKKHGADRVIHVSWPEDYFHNQEEMIATAGKIADDPDIKVLIVNQAVPGTTVAVEELKKKRDDMFVIFANLLEEQAAASEQADIILSADDLGMGNNIPAQAKKMGAKTLVYYSFRGVHEGDCVYTRTAMMQDECEKLGIAFVHRSTPHPTSELGFDNAQEFFVEDIKESVIKYGKNTAFFSSNCALQSSLIEACAENGAIYPQPCCPSPFHGFAEAFGLDPGNYSKEDAERILTETNKILAGKGVLGRFSTWPVSAAAMFTNAAADYGFKWMSGEVPKEGFSKDILLACMEEYAGVPVGAESYTDYDGKTYENVLMVMEGYYNYGDPVQGVNVEPSTETAEEKPKLPGKIAIVTEGAEKDSETYFIAEELVRKYGEDNVVHVPKTYEMVEAIGPIPIRKIGADPDVKVLIVSPAYPGTNAELDYVAEFRDDLLIIAIHPQENPRDVSLRVDLALMPNEVEMGYAIPTQAKKMGAKTLVHYSFPRHMSQELISERRDVLERECERLGIEFVDATAIDPTSEAGTAGAQQFIREDVPVMIAKYGKDTAFFTTNCALQVPLIQACAENGAIYPQPCCPSPYHGFAEAFGLDPGNYSKEDTSRILTETNKILAEKGVLGRFSTWPVSAEAIFTNAAAYYGVKWMNGEVPREGIDKNILKECMEEYAGVPVSMENYKEDNQTFDNFLMIAEDYYTYGDPLPANPVKKSQNSPGKPR